MGTPEGTNSSGCSLQHFSSHTMYFSLLTLLKTGENYELEELEADRSTSMLIKLFGFYFIIAS